MQGLVRFILAIVVVDILLLISCMIVVFVEVIEAYQKLDEQDPKYETSEMIMYKNMIIEQMGKIDDALAHLDANWDEVMIGLIDGEMFD